MGVLSIPLRMYSQGATRTWPLTVAACEYIRRGMKSRPNANQNHGIDPKCLSILLNSDLSIHYNGRQHCIAKTFNFHYKSWSGAATSGFLWTSHDQCRSMLINTDQWRFNSAWAGIERNWSELIDIGINARILIGIGHWSRESCILDHRCRPLYHRHRQDTHVHAMRTNILIQNTLYSNKDLT